MLSKEINLVGAFPCWVMCSPLEWYRLPDGKTNLMTSLLRLNYFTAPRDGSLRQMLPTFSQRFYPVSLSLSNHLGSWVPPEGTCGRSLVLVHGSPSYVTFIFFGVNVSSCMPWLHHSLHHFSFPMSFHSTATHAHGCPGEPVGKSAVFTPQVTEMDAMVQRLIWAGISHDPPTWSPW